MHNTTIIPINDKVPIDKNTIDHTLFLAQLLAGFTTFGVFCASISIELDALTIVSFSKIVATILYLPSSAGVNVNEPLYANLDNSS